MYYPAALPPTPDTELYLALAQVQQGSNLAAGIPRLQKAIESHGSAPTEFYYELARAHAKAGNQAEVIRWSEAALARDATFAPALKELAGAATALGQGDRAIEALRRAVTLRPGDSHALADLGKVYLQRQQVSRSRTSARTRPGPRHQPAARQQLASDWRPSRRATSAGPSSSSARRSASSPTWPTLTVTSRTCWPGVGLTPRRRRTSRRRCVTTRIWWLPIMATAWSWR